MKPLAVIVILVLGLAWTALAEESKPSEITKLEVVDLGEVGEESDSKISESQRKRDSGYVYNRPDRLSARIRFNGPGHRQNLNGNRGKILTRYPSQTQSQRPFTSYGTPLQTGPVGRPSSQYLGPQNSNFNGNQNQAQSNGHKNHQNQFSNQSNRPNSGYFKQEVPSPIRHADFVHHSPIASQNNEPFGQNTANYLPPGNQELPTYSAPNTFGPGEQQSFQQQNSQIQGLSGDLQFQGHNSNLQSQNPNVGISDAANFLAQNAQAISQLYGQPATDQNFAPNNEEFLGQNNQIQGVFGPSSGQNSQSQNQQFATFDQGSQSQGFPGPLPSYASGTLGTAESLEEIQSKEKDRLIVQLRALLSQSRSENAARAELSEQYAQSHGNYIQNQNLLASISSQFQNQQNYNGQNKQNVNHLSPGLFGSANTAFGQAPFIPGTSTSPTYTLGYDLTTPQTPTTTTTTTTTTVAPIQPSQNPKGDGSSQAGSSVPAPTLSFPQYGGFVPSVIGGHNFVGNFPSYNTLGSGFLPTHVQPAESSPTHFGLPIPQDPNASQQPQVTGTSVQNPVQSSPKPVALPSSPAPVGRPVAIPVQPVQPIHPIHPIHPVHALHPVHPIAPLAPAVTPVHSIQQFHPIVQPVQPVSAPIHPILPAAPAVTPIHSAPAAVHPIYPVQSAVYNPLLYKPIKTVHPVFYYPNLPYQVQKPALPTYPWSYAPSYAQAKPAQIWK